MPKPSRWRPVLAGAAAAAAVAALGRSTWLIPWTMLCGNEHRRKWRGRSVHSTKKQPCDKLNMYVGMAEQTRLIAAALVRSHQASSNGKCESSQGWLQTGRKQREVEPKAGFRVTSHAIMFCASFPSRHVQGSCSSFPGLLFLHGMYLDNG